MAASEDRSPRRKAPARSKAKANSCQTAASEALNAIVAHRRWTQMRLPSSAAGAPTAPDLADAARLVVASLQRLELTAPQLLTLLEALDAASAQESPEVIRTVVRGAVEKQWQEYVPGLRDEAMKRLREQSFWGNGFKDFLDRWPRLRSDSVLRTRSVDELASDLARVPDRLPSLRHLCGDLAAAQRVLCVCMSHGVTGFDPDELALLFGAWAGHTVWGQVQYRLWWIGKTRKYDATPLTDIPAAVDEAVQHIRQLRLTVKGESPELQLAEMAPESRAAWRRQLKRLVAADADLRAAVAEALLWYTTPVDDRQAQLAVMELYGHQVRAALAPLSEHCARIVRTRVESILGLVDAEPDVAELMDSRVVAQIGRTAIPDLSVRVHEPRTWIGDARVEGMIEAAIGSAADGYAREFHDTADSGEETHVANLFREVRHRLHAVNHRIATLAAELEANKRLVLRLDYRVIGKAEEGRPALGAPRFSTDVCLLVQAREGIAPPFARRVSFLQAKRLHVRKGAIEAEHYPIKSNQLEDLTKQTESSYILLIGPKRHDLAMPVLPARLVLDLIARGQLSSSLYPAALPPIARGLASWLTYDAIGLWTGDWRPAALRRAEGGKRRRPFLLVEITAEMETAGPDGWPR